MFTTMSPTKQPPKSAADDEDDDPEFICRVYSVLSYVFVLGVIGLPVWWFTTRVYRAPLPLDDMFSFEVPEKLDKKFGLPLSLEYDVLVTVVNPRPDELKVNLNTEEIDTALQPFLKSVSSVANFTVKSQWLYLVELGVQPKKFEDHYALFEEQLPHIVTPLEKKLWSHLSPRPCINLVIYVSQCSFPLRLYDSARRPVPSNSFINPGWGGITVLNPNEEACSKQMYTPNVSQIIPVFTTQLRKLFDIENTNVLSFKKRQAEKMIDSSKRTLKSLAQLLIEISSIVISDDVADRIKIAIKATEDAETLLKQGDLDEGLNKAKIAFWNSESAFSDPSLLALLYFPDDQK